MSDHYKYAISRARKRPLRPVTRDASTMYTRDLISLAVARFRAIELANGMGVINDSEDVERWMGVDKIHPEESRLPPVVWTSDALVITLSESLDGYASGTYFVRCHNSTFEEYFKVIKIDGIR